MVAPTSLSIHGSFFRALDARTIKSSDRGMGIPDNYFVRDPLIERKRDPEHNPSPTHRLLVESKFA